MMFDKRNYALSPWMNVVKVMSSWRNAVTIGSIAILLAACTDYSQKFEEEYEFGPGADRASGLDGDTLKDFRDNITYSVRKVGNLWWMMDDLAHPYFTDDAYKGTYCYKDKEGVCDEIGRLYPGEYLEYACPKGWRLPSVKEWSAFFNSNAFREYTPRHNGASDLYKGYVDGEHTLNGYGEDAYYWTNSNSLSDSYIDCVHYKRNWSSSGGIEPDYSSLSTAELCHEQWKLAVRCVMNAEEADVDLSSSEQNAEEKEYDCSVTDGVKIVSPADGESFRIGDSVNVVFGSDQDYGGFMIELRFNDGASRVLLLDETLEGVTDGITCNEKKILLSAEIGVEAANDAYIYIAPYAKQSKAGKSGTFNILNACQRPAYCYRTTVDSQRHCDLDKEVTEVKVQQAKDEGIFKEEFEDCWDL